MMISTYRKLAIVLDLAIFLSCCLLSATLLSLWPLHSHASLYIQAPIYIVAFALIVFAAQAMIRLYVSGFLLMGEYLGLPVQDERSDKTDAR